MRLSNYPYISAEEFEAACHALCARADRAIALAQVPGWQRVQLKQAKEEVFVIIESSLPGFSTSSTTGPAATEKEQSTDDEEISDDGDEDALPRSSDYTPHILVQYTICLSRVYGVPMLYFSLRDLPPDVASGLDAVYTYLVPQQFRSSMQEVGVMGAISMGYHPISDIPSFFVHPCNTAIALEALEDGGNAMVEHYLLVWLGIVGSPVGLNAPSSIAVQHE